MQIDIGKTCKQIMDPEVPHALRLQAILTSGVCIVFQRQSTFLLDDCYDALKHVNTAATVVGEEIANGGLLEARPEDIDLRGDVAMDPNELFPDFTTVPTPLRLVEDNDEVILMPSIPESAQNHFARGQRSPEAPPPEVEEYFLMNMDTMDVPDLPDGIFNFPEPGPEDMAGMDMFMMQDNEMPMPPPEEEQQQAHIEEEGAQTIKRARRSKTRNKKAKVDEDDEIYIDRKEFERSITTAGYIELLVPRPRVVPPREGGLSLAGASPATGPWPEELADIWKACDDGLASKKPRGVATPAAGEGKKGSKRARLALEEEQPFAMDHPPVDDYFIPPTEYPMDEGYPQGEDFMAQYISPRAEGSPGGEEAERLRAALHATPGADYKGVMFQLGLTPASDETASGARQRLSGASRRDSRGGRLSEKSSDRVRNSTQLADLLEELQGTEDLGAALPAVGEEDGHLLEGGVSQFSLVEDSGPSIPSLSQFSPAKEHMHTLEVLASMRLLTKTNELLLFRATGGLRRREAAQVFSHILVGSSRGFVSSHQAEPYGDITIQFHN